VAHLERIPAKDKEEFSAYRYQDWIFWINKYKNQCRFYMRLTHNNIEQSGAVTRRSPVADF